MRESIHAIRCDFLCLQDTQSKDSIVEDLHELHDSVVEEPVCEGWVLDDSLGSGSPGVRVVGADELSQLWPLEVCCTVSEEDCRQI